LRVAAELEIELEPPFLPESLLLTGGLSLLAVGKVKINCKNLRALHLAVSVGPVLLFLLSSTAKAVKQLLVDGAVGLEGGGGVKVRVFLKICGKKWMKCLRILVIFNALSLVGKLRKFLRWLLSCSHGYQK